MSSRNLSQGAGKIAPKYANKNNNLTRAQIKHLIFDRTLSMLENKRVWHVESGKLLSFAWHERTKVVLRSEMPEIIVEQLENSILSDAENLPG